MNTVKNQNNGNEFDVPAVHQIVSDIKGGYMQLMSEKMAQCFFDGPREAEQVYAMIVNHCRLCEWVGCQLTVYFF